MQNSLTTTTAIRVLRQVESYLILYTGNVDYGFKHAHTFTISTRYDLAYFKWFVWLFIGME